MHKSPGKEFSVPNPVIPPSEADYSVVYRGASMEPTFKPGQLLRVRVDAQKIIPGDVIVFKGQPDSQHIVHRVVSVSAGGVLTRGDHNKSLDPYLVALDRVIGKVEQVQVLGEWRPVRGGRPGLWHARVQWFMTWLDVRFRRMFWRPYGLLRSSRIVPRLWRPAITVVQLQTEHGPLVKYIYRQRTVALWNPSTRRFECRKPFDLVIPSPLDEAAAS